MANLTKGRVHVIIDGQWGSTGKGKLSGYLALRNDVSLVTCDFNPNAGHTWKGDVDGCGIERTIVNRQLPTSCINVDAAIAISAASGISVKLLLEEIEMLSDLNIARRLVIDPHAHIVEEKHVVAENSRHDGTKRFASTMKGCGAALADKTMRRALLARDVPELQRWIGNTSELVHSTLKSGGSVLAESAQGFDLSLNHGCQYPFVTSRDVTTASVLSNIGVPPQLLGEVFGCLRTFPIRVGNVVENGETTGVSGPFWPDQVEISWDQLRDSSGAHLDITEKTTVTGRTRRVFTFSDAQLKKFIQVCAPTHLFVNFANHVNWLDTGVRDYNLLTDRTKSWMEQMMSVVYNTDSLVPRSRLSFIGTGASDEDMVEVR